MSSPPDPSRPSSPSSFSPLWGSALHPAAAGQTSWLWQGFLASGNVTLLTSQWKSGKTTLVSVLLARMGTGGQLAGLAVTPGKVVVVTEESPRHWYDRSQKLQFGDHICWLCRPFEGKPSTAQWQELIDWIVRMHEEHSIKLAVIDPLACFLPGKTENVASAMLDALLPLQRLTRRSIAVLVLHHPHKGDIKGGQAARGSGALGGYVDILLEMRWFARPSDPDRRRVIEAYSRHEQTPRRLVIEWTPDGTDYLSHGDLGADDFALSWQLLAAILEAAARPLTRREIGRQWPADAQRPNDVTLWRWLERAVGEGRIVQEGRGRRNDPFRFCLPPEQEEESSPQGDVT